MSKKLYIRTSQSTSGIELPWRIAGLNADGVSTTWQKQENNTDPKGQYWKTNADDTFDKTVWVLEGEAPVVLKNPIEDQAPEQIAASDVLLSIQMATGTGQRIPGWDAYEDIILGETTSKFYFDMDIGRLDWTSWRNNAGEIDGADLAVYSVSSITSLGKSAGFSVPRNGSTILGYRIIGSGLSSDITDNPWKPVASAGKLNTTSVSGFTGTPEHRQTLSRHDGKEHFTLLKSVLAKATSKAGGATSQTLQLTWMPAPKKDGDALVGFDMQLAVTSYGKVGGIGNIISNPQYFNRLCSVKGDFLLFNISGAIQLANVSSPSGPSVRSTTDSLVGLVVSYKYNGVAKTSKAGISRPLDSSIEGITLSTAGMSYTGGGYGSKQLGLGIPLDLLREGKQKQWPNVLKDVVVTNVKVNIKTLISMVADETGFGDRPPSYNYGTWRQE